MNTVFTPDGWGRVLRTESARGRTSYLIKGAGFEGWYDSLQVTADFADQPDDVVPNEDNETTLPYPSRPQGPGWDGSTSTIEPGIDPHLEMGGASDSLTGESTDDDPVEADIEGLFEPSSHLAGVNRRHRLHFAASDDPTLDVSELPEESPTGLDNSPINPDSVDTDDLFDGSLPHFERESAVSYDRLVIKDSLSFLKIADDNSDDEDKKKKHHREQSSGQVGYPRNSDDDDDSGDEDSDDSSSSRDGDSDSSDGDSGGGGHTAAFAFALRTTSDLHFLANLCVCGENFPLHSKLEHRELQAEAGAEEVDAQPRDLDKELERYEQEQYTYQKSNLRNLVDHSNDDGDGADLYNHYASVGKTADENGYDKYIGSNGDGTYHLIASGGGKLPKGKQYGHYDSYQDAHDAVEAIIARNHSRHGSKTAAPAAQQDAQPTQIESQIEQLMQFWAVDNNGWWHWTGSQADLALLNQMQQQMMAVGMPGGPPGQMQVQGFAALLAPLLEAGAGEAGGAAAAAEGEGAAGEGGGGTTSPLSNLQKSVKMPSPVDVMSGAAGALEGFNGGKDVSVVHHVPFQSYGFSIEPNIPAPWRQYLQTLASDRLVALAAWRDVVDKSKRLRSEGAIDVEAFRPDVITAYIQGDHGRYYTTVQRLGSVQGLGRQGLTSAQVSGWSCDCDWGHWAWLRKRSFVGRMCFVPGTLVTMANGSLKEIETVEVGDLVRSHTGEARRVNNTIINYHDGNLYGVKPRGREIIWATAEHPWYALHGRGSVKCDDCWDKKRQPDYCRKFHTGRTSLSPDWIETKNLTTDHLLTATAPKIDEKSVVFDMADYCENGFIESGDLVYRKRVLHNGARAKSGKPVSRFVKFDGDLAYLLGLWVGDGGKNANNVAAFWFGLGEISMAERVVSIVKEKFGVDAVVDDKSASGQNIIQVRVASAIVLNFFKTEAGLGTRKKLLSDKVMSSSASTLVNLLRGWFDSDNGNSVNRSLVHQMEQISLRSGIPYSVGRVASSYQRNDLVGHNATDSFVMKVSWRILEGSTQWSNNFMDVDTNYLKVENVEMKSYVGPVYNLSVDVDESYQVYGINTHNCSHAYALFNEMRSLDAKARKNKGRPLNAGKISSVSSKTAWSRTDQGVFEWVSDDPTMPTVAIAKTTSGWNAQVWSDGTADDSLNLGVFQHSEQARRAASRVVTAHIKLAESDYIDVVGGENNTGAYPPYSAPDSISGGGYDPYTEDGRPEDMLPPGDQPGSPGIQEGNTRTGSLSVFAEHDDGQDDEDRDPDETDDGIEEENPEDESLDEEIAEDEDNSDADDGSDEDGGEDPREDDSDDGGHDEPHKRDDDDSEDESEGTDNPGDESDDEGIEKQSSVPELQARFGLSHLAGANYSVAEQNSLVREGEGKSARNRGDLNLTGTHYEATAGSAESAEDTLAFLF